MVLHQVRDPVLHRDTHYVDSIKRQSSVLGGAHRTLADSARVHERLRATSAGLLERSHLRNHIVERVPNPVRRLAAGPSPSRDGDCGRHAPAGKQPKAQLLSPPEQRGPSQAV